MKIRRKIITVLFLLMMVMTWIFPVALADNVHVFYATFNISMHTNKILSRYGVTVYLDGVYVAHMEQGDLTTFGAYMTDDKPHVLTLDPDKEGVPDRTWTISNLQHGSVLTAEIQTKRNQVKIRSYSLNVNGTDLFSVSPDMEQQVRLLGTVVITGLEVYGASQGLSTGN